MSQGSVGTREVGALERVFFFKGIFLSMRLIRGV